MYTYIINFKNSRVILNCLQWLLWEGGWSKKQLTGDFAVSIYSCISYVTFLQRSSCCTLFHFIFYTYIACIFCPAFQTVLGSSVPEGSLRHKINVVDLLHSQVLKTLLFMLKQNLKQKVNRMQNLLKLFT